MVAHMCVCVTLNMIQTDLQNDEKKCHFKYRTSIPFYCADKCVGVSL